MLKDEDVIDLRSSVDVSPKHSVDEPLDKPEFVIEHVKHAQVHAKKLDDEVLESSDKVKVKFDKFVNLIDTKVDDDLVDKYMNEDVIVSTSLLTELASANASNSNKKMYVLFLGGLCVGALIVWFILRT